MKHKHNFKKRHQYNISNISNIENIEGDGVIDYITDKFKKFSSSVTGRPKLINELMEKTKNIPVVGITVCRKPITPIFRTILNKLTGNNLTKKMNQLGYDQLFHLYVKFRLANGEDIRLEKNQRVMLRTGEESKETEQTPTLTMNDGKDIKTYILNLESKNIPNIWVYSAFDMNCQHFVRNLLNSNGITQYDNFITQNTTVLGSNFLKRMSNIITSTAAVANTIYRGGKYGNGFGLDLLTPDVTLEDNINNFGAIAGDAYDMW